MIVCCGLFWILTSLGLGCGTGFGLARLGVTKCDVDASNLKVQ